MFSVYLAVFSKSAFSFQAVHEEILSHQQPILSLVYQAEQLTELYQEELTPEQVTSLSGEAGSLKKALEKVSTDFIFTS